MEASEPSNVGSNVYSFPRDIEAGMEQKKILWIVVAVGVFVLVIFGTALILYSPSRSSGAVNAQATAVSQERLEGTAPVRRIDPDDWVRNPDTTPNLDSTVPPPRGDVNVTIVNGDNASAQYGVLDVTGLTQRPARSAVPAGTEVPADIPGMTKTDAGAATGAERPVTDGKATDGPKETQTATAAKSTGSKSSTTKPAAQKARATADKTTTKKPAPKKAVTVTEYWIQTGSFTGKLNAEKARAKLSERYINAEIFTKSVKDTTSYRVRVGPYKTKKEADYWLGTIKTLPEFASSYVSEVKTKK